MRPGDSDSDEAGLTRIKPGDSDGAAAGTGPR
jgi:hypothetical protein